MSAPVDTSAAAVEAIATDLECSGRKHSAALLRALLRERDEARAEAVMAKSAAEQLCQKRDEALAALATARADALREAAKLAEKQRLTKLDDQNLEHVGHFRACMALELAILALTQKEPRA